MFFLINCIEYNDSVSSYSVWVNPHPAPLTEKNFKFEDID